MAVVLDLIGMLIIRASIIAIILNLMVNMHEALYKYVERNSMNTALVGVQQTISADIVLAGYNSTEKRFRMAYGNYFSFRTDYDNDGDADSIYYYVTPTSGVNKTLHRVVYTVGTGANTQDRVIAHDVDTFYLKYYSASGTALTYGVNKTVKSLVITLRLVSKNSTLTVQSGKTDSVSRKVTWEQHFFPENLY